MSTRRDTLPDGLLLSWYGDDFTGSAAVMEVMSFAGLHTVLFLDAPTSAQLARFDDLRGIGIASTARSQAPAWMETHLPPAFEWLAEQGAPICHYKVCSTLDSAPEVGSIGKAIDLIAPRFAEGWIPCLIAAPAIRRYQAFGTLFAAAPTGVYRLDRHPVMAIHPVTPMSEADVALHLARQTDRPLGLIDVEDLTGDADGALARLRAEGAEVICLDTITADHLCRVGRLIWEHRGAGLFAVGSQGVEYALIAHWQDSGQLAASPPQASAGRVDHMIGVSGSVSPVTAAQIDWAEANGFAVIELDAAGIVRGDPECRARVVDAALAALAQGRDPLIVTARGPDDPAVARQRRALDDTGQNPTEANARIGKALGETLAELLQKTGLRRAVISGGDTSGHASRQLDIFAFTALAPTIPGAALLQAHSENPAFDGLQLALKGGQMGSPDYFGWIKQGGGARTTGE